MNMKHRIAYLLHKYEQKMPVYEVNTDLDDFKPTGLF